MCSLSIYPLLRVEKPQSWSEDIIIQLQGSLVCTNCDIFDGDLNSRVTVFTDYLYINQIVFQFCCCWTLNKQKTQKM